jgi:hypothetical protein
MHMMMSAQTFSDITSGIVALWNGDGLAAADKFCLAGMEDDMIKVLTDIVTEPLLKGDRDSLRKAVRESL